MLGVEEYIKSSIVTKKELRNIIKFYIKLLKVVSDQLYELRRKT